MSNLKSEDGLKFVDDYLKVNKGREEDLIRLHFKNQSSAYLYWQFKKGKVNELLSRLSNEEGLNDNLLLRVECFDQEGGFYRLSKQIKVGLEDNKAYLKNLKSGHTYKVKLGLWDSENNFSSLLESNHINLPRAEISRLNDEGNQGDIDKIYGISEGDSDNCNSSYDLVK